MIFEITLQISKIFEKFLFYRFRCQNPKGLLFSSEAWRTVTNDLYVTHFHLQKKNSDWLKINRKRLRIHGRQSSDCLFREYLRFLSKITFCLLLKFAPKPLEMFDPRLNRPVWNVNRAIFLFKVLITSRILYL